MPVDLSFLKHVAISAEEKKFLTDSNTAVTADMNQSRVASELYFAKTIEKCVDRQIESNKDLADSNEKYSSRMVWLTVGLIVVAVIQAGISYFSIRESRMQVAREHTLSAVSELMQNLRDTQQVYLNPGQYPSKNSWQEAMRKVNANLNKSFGSSLLFLSNKEGRIFSEYSDLQVEYLRRVSISRDMAIDPNLKKEFSDRFYDKTRELAKAVRERLLINDIAGEPKI